MFTSASIKEFRENSLCVWVCFVFWFFVFHQKMVFWDISSGISSPFFGKASWAKWEIKGAGSCRRDCGPSNTDLSTIRETVGSKRPLQPPKQKAHPAGLLCGLHTAFQTRGLISGSPSPASQRAVGTGAQEKCFPGGECQVNPPRISGVLAPRGQERKGTTRVQGRPGVEDCEPAYPCVVRSVAW